MFFFLDFCHPGFPYSFHAPPLRPSLFFQFCIYSQKCNYIWRCANFVIDSAVINRISTDFEHTVFWDDSVCIVFHPHSLSSFSVLFTCTLKAQNTKLVHASTTASWSSAMLEKHGSTHSSRSTRSSRLARQSRTCRVVSSRAKWNLGLCHSNVHVRRSA